MTAAQAWIVRAGRDDEYAALALDRGVVGLAWHKVGDLGHATTQRAVRSLVAEAYPDEPAAVRTLYALQLHAFRTAIRPGHLVVLLHRTRPEVAVGEITGDYRYEPDGGGPAHVRAVNWLQPALRRGELGPTVLAVPALAAVSRVTRPDDRDRVAEAAKGVTRVGEPAVRPAGEPASAATGLRGNLEYARNLATAGSHLEALGVTSFEHGDVYRAAWTQAVASLDHWVGQEITARSTALLAGPADRWPPTFGRVLINNGKRLAELREKGEAVLRRAISKQVADGRTVFQSPSKIEQAIEDVTEITDLWDRVGAVLTPPAPPGEVQVRLAETVQRRHKIVHRYDEDPDNPPYKRAIDVTATMAAIDLIDQVTAGILLVIDGK